MRIRTTALAAILALIVAGSVHADDTQSRELAALKQAQQKLAGRPLGQKGGVNLQLLGQRNRLNRLIADLESGKKVDPADVDRAVNAANNAPW